MHQTTVTRTGIKVRNPFLFRFRRWEILKGKNSAKSRHSKFETRIRLKQSNFENLTQNFTP